MASSLCAVDEAWAIGKGKGKGLARANQPAPQQSSDRSDARPASRSGTPESRLAGAPQRGDVGNTHERNGGRAAYDAPARERDYRQPIYSEPVRREHRGPVAAGRQPTTSGTTGGPGYRPIRRPASQPPVAHQAVSTPAGHGEPPGQAGRETKKADRPPNPADERRRAAKPAGSNGQPARSEPARYGTTNPPGHEAGTPPGQAKKAGSQESSEPPGQAKKTQQHEPPGQVKKESQQPSGPPGQVKHQDPRPAGYGGRSSSNNERAVGKPAVESMDSQATGPRSSHGASREARSPEVLAPGGERRFGGAPRAARTGTGRADQTVVSAAERTVPPSAGPGVQADKEGEEPGTKNVPLPGYFAERAGTVLEPLRGTAAAMLGWTEQAASSVVERAVELLENILPQGGYGKHGPPDRAPPLPPGTGSSSGSVFSSGAGVGESGSGPLLAVLSLLIILARGGRFWPPYELPRPRLIPRLVSERPG